MIWPIVIFCSTPARPHGRFVAASGPVPELLLKTSATEISQVRFNALTDARGG